MGAFSAQNRVPQQAMEVVITAADMNMQEVVDVVKEKVYGRVMFVVVKA